MNVDLACVVFKELTSGIGVKIVGIIKYEKICTITIYSNLDEDEMSLVLHVCDRFKLKFDPRFKTIWKEADNGDAVSDRN